jgi:predicted DNA-binding transcriptional regulator YafY
MINVNQLYENAFGIETYETAEKVILKFDNSQAVYLKSLPVHHSQKILEETPNAFIIELFVHPTFDFVLEILKYGDLVEVLAPLKLRETIMLRIYRANQKYQ